MLRLMRPQKHGPIFLGLSFHHAPIWSSSSLTSSARTDRDFLTVLPFGATDLPTKKYHLTVALTFVTKEPFLHTNETRPLVGNPNTAEQTSIENQTGIH
jgi:hypothetical protein